MSSISKVGGQAYNNYFGAARSVKSSNEAGRFGEILENRLYGKSKDNYNSYSRGMSVSPVLQDRKDTLSNLVITDVTKIHYPECDEPGERMLEAILPGYGIPITISLRPCSMNTVIDQDKLKEIFGMVFMFCEKVLPILQKATPYPISGMGVMGMPFNEATGEVDFKPYFRAVFDVMSKHISYIVHDEDLKLELQKMMIECEEAFFKALDEADKNVKESQMPERSEGGKTEIIFEDNYVKFNRVEK